MPFMHCILCCKAIIIIYVQNIYSTEIVFLKAFLLVILMSVLTLEVLRGWVDGEILGEIKDDKISV